MKRVIGVTVTVTVTGAVLAALAIPSPSWRGRPGVAHGVPPGPDAVAPGTAGG